MIKQPKFRAPMNLVGLRYYNPEYFLRHTDKTQDCWTWQGPKNNLGYGLVGCWHEHDGKKMMLAHRLALMIKLGRELTPGLNANHSCHNRNCVNPQHLSEGTQQQKIIHMQVDGKLKTGDRSKPRGSYNHKQENRKYRYSEEYIQWIRSASTAEISAKENISLDHAGRRQYMFRAGYRWLPQPCEYVKRPKGPRPKNK